MELSPMQIMLMGQRDEKSTRALADGLRNRKDLGDLVSLVGTKNQRDFGGGLTQDVQYQQGMKEKGDQRAMTQGYYNDITAGRTSALQETIRHNKEMEDYYRNRDTAQSRMQKKDFDNNVRKLSEKMTQMGIPELQYDVGRINDSLKPYMDDKNKDIPGIGQTGMVPNMFIGDEGVKIRQGLAAVRNKLLKVRSGAAVTDPEMARFAQELITTMDTISTDRELLLTWPQVAAGISKIESGISAGYDPEVVETFRGRMGQSESDPGDTGVDWTPTPDNVNPDTGNEIVDWGS